MFKETRFKSVIRIFVCTILFTIGASLVLNVSNVLAEQSERISYPASPINYETFNIDRVDGGFNPILGSVFEENDPAMVESVPSPSSADSIFYVSTSGSDSNPGTYAKPWRTINKAAQTLSSGQTAIVLAGTYSERINLSRSGIILKTDGKVVMKGFEVHGNNNQIIGFKISDKNSDAGLEVHGDNNLFQNNEIYRMGQDGIWFHGSGNTYRGNYIHDILDSSIGGDPHVDCFQSWTWGGAVKNTLFEGNTCEHTRSTGSNQITMIESKNAEISNLVFQNNTFVMHDAGYTPLRINRKDGQYPITNIQVVNNTFKNATGNGDEAINFVNVTDSQISGNTVIGYDQVVTLSGCSRITNSNNILKSSADSQGPALYSPSGTISDSTPTYQWSDVGNATDYLVAVKNADTDAWLVWNWIPSSSICSAGSCSVEPGVGLPNANYSLWVVGKNGSELGIWSKALSFKVNSPMPGQPKLVAPTGTISDSTPTYQWSDVGNATDYLVVVRNADTNAWLVWDWFPAGPICSAGSCSIELGVGLPNANYYLWVVGKNGSGLGIWSSPVYFTVNSTTPGKPTLVAPTGTISDSAPTYRWSDVGNATDYLVAVKNANTGVWLAWEWLTASTICSAGTCSVELANVLPSANYYWWVVGQNASGLGIWSNPLNFTLSN